MKEIVEIIKEAQKESMRMIGNLFLKYGLDPREYKSIFKKMRFDDTREYEVAIFSCPDDEIIFTSKYIGIIKRGLDNAKDKEKLKKIIIDDVAKVIAHETVHACRVISSKDKVSFHYILSSIVGAQNEIDDDYISRIVACYVDLDITREEYNKDIENNFEKCNDVINRQESLEECLTEGFAQISYRLLKEDKKMEEIIEDIIQTPNMRPDAIVGVMIINKLDDNMIRWFLTTSFNENYKDMLKEEFKEDYPYVLSVADKTYRSYLASEFEKINYEEINEFEEFLNKRSEKHGKTK